MINKSVIGQLPTSLMFVGSSKYCGWSTARILTPDWCRYSIVSKKWRMIAQDSRLWAMVSLRPEISGLMIPNMEMLLKLIQNRCTQYTHSAQ